MYKVKRIVNKKSIEDCKSIGYCQVCGRIGNDPHHIVTRGASGPDHKYNLICLCRLCHIDAHSGKLEKELLFDKLSTKYRKDIDENTIFAIMRGGNNA
jgi:hypothetical protein